MLASDYDEYSQESCACVLVQGDDNGCAETLLQPAFASVETRTCLNNAFMLSVFVVRERMGIASVHHTVGATCFSRRAETQTDIHP